MSEPQYAVPPGVELTAVRRKLWIGAPVHYRSYGTPNGEYKPECRAAIITQIGAWIAMSGHDETDEWTDGGIRFRQLIEAWTPDACHLKIENPGGTFNNVCRFDEPPLAENVGMPPTPGAWHWPEPGE